MEEALDFKTAARILGVKATSLRAHYRRWGIPHFRIGRLVRFRPSELEEFIQLHSHGGPALVKATGARLASLLRDRPELKALRDAD